MISVNLDLSEIAELLQVQDAAIKAIRDAASDLAKMAHARILELANSSLHSRRELFIENLSEPHQVGDDVWMITLAAKARWIDDGLPERNMLDDLLSSPKAKQAKDGSTYVVIPFRHGPGKGATTTTPAQADLISTVKAAMKTRGIPFGKLENGADGKPKIGKLHSFDLMKDPIKTAEGPGQGKGLIGSVKQGPTGIPLLQGVSVYQNRVKNKDGTDGVKKSIVTFRIASSKHRDQGGRWDHPGVPAMNIMEDAIKWVMETWASKVEPEIVARIIAQIA